MLPLPVTLTLYEEVRTVIPREALPRAKAAIELSGGAENQRLKEVSDLLDLCRALATVRPARPADSGS